MEARHSRQLRVLQSVRPPAETTNPYLVQLVQACRVHAEVSYFGWRQALFGRYDVLHIHWPEVLLRRDRRAARLFARMRFTALMVRISALGTPVVRTVHNVAPHEPGSAAERCLIAWCNRRTRYWIRLNPSTPPPRSGPSRVIPHGHYRDWYPPTGEEAVPGRLLHFGLIRPYKGLDALLTAFGRLKDPAVSLDIVGRPTTAELRARVEAAVARDPRVRARLEHLDERTLTARIEQAQLVVLPYRELHNSGALLLALSLNRPVLVPDGPLARAFAAEVGPGWVLPFHGPLTAADLAEALALTSRRRPGTPDLSRRTWPEAAAAHLEVYRAATARRPRFHERPRSDRLARLGRPI